MLDISWGEIAIVTGVGLALIGRKDLPKAANVVGTQVGRVVGLLQGARARADRFAEQSELRQLQNELRSGLRELDAVRSEMAVSMSVSSGVGGTITGGMSNRHSLGALTANVDTKYAAASPASRLALPAAPPSPSMGYTLTSSSALDMTESVTQPSLPAMSTLSVNDTAGSPTVAASLSTSSSAYQTTAAVAEQEWIARGMAFSSAAEQGRGITGSAVPRAREHKTYGSVVLSQLLQESLIFDRYDGVVAEQDAILQSKLSSILSKTQHQQASLDEPASASSVVHASKDPTRGEAKN